MKERSASLWNPILCLIRTSRAGEADPCPGRVLDRITFSPEYICKAGSRQCSLFLLENKRRDEKKKS
jgi:hypothetical protein